MTCKHCCGADQLFDLKGAEKELKKYKKKGPGKVTRKLIELLKKEDDLNGNTLLDIGGGIGAIQWGFLENGGKSTIDVDASNGYQHVAKTYAKELGFEEKAKYVFGDFVDQSAAIDEVDFVTMDKVLCCYPDYEGLLKQALLKCKKSILISYPLGGMISEFIAQLNKIYFYFKKNPFRTYIHSPKQIEKFIIDHGFEVKYKSISFPWHVQVYQRIE